MKRTKLDYLFYLLSFIIPLVVYSLTLPPSITFGDSGEFVTAAYSLGIPHPPGNPFWVATAHLFTYLPVNSVAWRVNFSSAFFTALSCLLIFNLVKTLLRSQGPALQNAIALSGSLAFAFLASSWGYALIAKPLALNTLLFLILLSLLITWHFTENIKLLYLFSLIAGLSLTNHYLIAITFPAFFLWLIFVKPRLFISKRVFPLLFFFLLGLSFFLYLPIRAQANPAINWGNPDSIEKLIAVLQRKQFNRSFASGEGKFLASLSIKPGNNWQEMVLRIFTSPFIFMKILYSEFKPVFYLFGLLGLFYSFFPENKKVRKISLLLLFCFLASGPGFVFLTHAAFSKLALRNAEYLLAYAIFSLWIGVGTLFIVTKIKRYPLSLPVLLLTFSASGYLLWQNLKINNWSGNDIAYIHGMNILNQVEPKAIIFADKNNWIFPLLYLSKVEHVRPDVTIYDRSGNLFDLIYNNPDKPFNTFLDFEIYRKEVEAKIIRENPSRPVYFAADKDFENSYDNLPSEGILYRAINKATKEIDWQKDYGQIFKISNDFWQEFDTSYILAYYRMRYADELLSQNKKEGALEQLKIAYHINPDHPVLLTNIAAYYQLLDRNAYALELLKREIALFPDSEIAKQNIASIYTSEGKIEEAKKYYQETLKLNPQNLQALLALGAIYEKDNQWKEALAGFKETFKFYPQTHLEGKIVTLHLKLGNCDEAIVLFDLYKSTLEKNPVIYNNLGICFAQKSDYIKASEYFKKALVLDPAYKTALDNLTRLKSMGIN